MSEKQTRSDYPHLHTHYHTRCTNNDVLRACKKQRGVFQLLRQRGKPDWLIEQGGLDEFHQGPNRIAFVVSSAATTCPSASPKPSITACASPTGNKLSGTTNWPYQSRCPKKPGRRPLRALYLSARQNRSCAIPEGPAQHWRKFRWSERSAQPRQAGRPAVNSLDP